MGPCPYRLYTWDVGWHSVNLRIPLKCTRNMVNIHNVAGTKLYKKRRESWTSDGYPLGWDREVEVLPDSFLTSLAHLK